MGDYRHNPLYTEDINTHLLFTVWRYPCIQEVAGGGEVCALGKAILLGIDTLVYSTR